MNRDLRDCELSNLPAGIFDSLINLEILWLDGNELSRNKLAGLPNDVFSNLQYLETL